MIYSVTKVAKLIGVSRVTIYKKLKQLNMSTHMIKKSNITYIDDIGLQMIKDDIIDLTEEQADTTSNTATEPQETVVSDSIGCINILTAQNKKLWKMIEEKDNQINDYSERLKQSLELNRNSQVLLKDKPHEDILLLEEHFQNLDTKLEEVKENMQQRKDHEKKSLFSKIFKGKD